MRHSGSVYSRSTPAPKMPPGLVELMEGLSKEVLKHNPPNVYEFCANHMQKLLEIRDGPSQKPISLDRKIKRAQEIIRKRSEQYWRNKNGADREKISPKVLNPVHHDSDLEKASEIEIACQPSQKVSVVENTKEIEQSNEAVQNSSHQSNKNVPSVSDESTKVVEAKVSADDILQKVSVEAVETLPKEVDIKTNEECNGSNAGEYSKQGLSDDIIIKNDITTEERTKEVSGNIKESADTPTLTETKLDQSAEDSTKITAEEASLPDNLVSNENITEAVAISAENETKQEQSCEDITTQNAEEVILPHSDAADKNIKETVDISALKGSKLEQSNEDNTVKISEGLMLPNSDVSVENIKVTVDTSAVLEPKLDQIQKDSEAATISSEDITIEESENSKSKEETTINVHEKQENIVDQNTESVNSNSISLLKEAVMNTTQNVSAVDDIQHQVNDDLNSFQNELIIKYSETEDDAENNSGVEIYITDESDQQLTEVQNAVIKDKAKADQITDEVKNSLKINLSVNDENLQTAAESPLLNDKVKSSETSVTSTEELVKSEQNIENKNSIKGNSEKEENTDFNIQDNSKQEQNDEAISHKNDNIESESNTVKDIGDVTSDSNDILKDDKHRSKREILNKEMEGKNLEVNEGEGLIDEEILLKKHHLPLSEVPQNVNNEDSKINQDYQKHMEDMSDNDKHSDAKDIRNECKDFTIKEPLETSEKQVSEEDVSEHSVDKSDLMSHDNLQTEIIADIKEHLEQMVQPKNETGNNNLEALEGQNTEKVDGTHVDDSTTEETNSINSVAEGGTTDRSDDTFQNDNPNTMDLETAAVTIQKVFRTFLFKSRASTFDESANDENNISDDDNDDDNKDSRAFLPQTLNKDRRALGISRMDTVLQTVNEEKSLSLSTDDSSTLSSAATVIQAHVRGFLVRNKLHSGKTASSTNSLINSDGPSSTSLDGDDQHKSKTILNIHIVPEGNNFLSRDESMITSMDLSLDGSPPSSVNLHPLSYDKISERRKQLKREDAIQSVSPPSNNSGKLSEDVESVKELPSNSGSPANASLEQETAAAIVTDDIDEEPKKDSVDTTPTNSITVETVIEVNNTELSTSPEPAQDMSDKARKSLTKQSSDEMDVVTPYRGNTPRDYDASSGLLHSGEFHDTVLPTKVSRSDTPVVSEFKNVLVYFLLWNNS